MLDSEKTSSKWEESFPVGKQFPKFQVGRELFSGKKAPWWKDSFSVGRQLPGEKRISLMEAAF